MEHKMTIAGLERALPLCKVTDDLYIEEGRQLLTLITCIRSEKPVVFDRYLVICEKKP